MEWETLLWVLSLITIGTLVFLQVFELIPFADLESDYINPIDLCSRLNHFIIPEAAAHAVTTILFLLSGFWFEFLMNVPLVAWHIYCFQMKQLFLDPTTIFSNIDAQKKTSYFKLGLYAFSFFFYLYRLIYTLVRDVVGTKEASQMINNMI